MRQVIKERLIVFSWSAVVVTAISLFFFSIAIYYARLDLPNGPSCVENFLFHFGRFFPLALLTPAIFALGRRWPLFSQQWKKYLAYHLGAGIVVAAIHLVLSYGLMELGLAIGWTKFRLMTAEESVLTFSHYNYLFFWIILFIGYFLEYYRKYRERELSTSHLETQLAQANLQMLKMQVHPHFLYNTLHAISALVYEDPDAADRMIIRLSELLRLTLDHKGDQEVSVREEMECLNLYLEIMKTRFDERLAVSLEVDPGAADARVPAFLLQPLVENAIRHGVLPRKNGGRVAVRIRRNKGVLILEIEDDGPGFAADHAALTKKGFGMTSTEERLRCLYGEGHGLILKNSQDGGALVRIEIPFRIAIGEIKAANDLPVRVRTDQGFVGFDEACPFPPITGDRRTTKRRENDPGPHRR
jgi:two-component sensor histidine kinase